MTTITDTPTRIVRYHEDSGIVECITFRVHEEVTQLKAVRIALTVREWAELKAVIPPNA